MCVYIFLNFRRGVRNSIYHIYFLFLFLIREVNFVLIIICVIPRSFPRVCVCERGFSWPGLIISLTSFFICVYFFYLTMPI